jgi:hypothetical protein
MAADVERIDVSNARTETAQGRALLVCGYEDDAKCRKGRLEGSIHSPDSHRWRRLCRRTRRSIFYCA